MTDFCDYIVYLDESGSPTITNIDSDFPVFVLACILVEKSVYAEKIVPAFQNFKFKFFGHDQIVLHEREIRRQSGKFSFFKPVRNYETRFLMKYRPSWSFVISRFLQQLWTNENWWQSIRRRIALMR